MQVTLGDIKLLYEQLDRNNKRYKVTLAWHKKVMSNSEYLGDIFSN